MSIAETVTNPDNILTVVVGLISFATIVTLAAPAMRGNSLEGRLKSVANRREELRRRSREALAQKSGGSTLRQTDTGVYKNVVDRLQLSRLLEDPKVAENLAMAGFRGHGRSAPSTSSASSCRSPWGCWRYSWSMC